MNKTFILVAILALGGALYFYSGTEDTTEVVVENETINIESGAPVSDVSDSEDSIVDEVVSNDEEAIGEAKVFEVGGKNFEFDVTEIRVKEGDTVTINFVSNDGFHDWVVDEFDAATERVQTDGRSSVTFVADASGTYEYYCSVGQHRQNGMVGTLIVE